MLGARVNNSRYGLVVRFESGDLATSGVDSASSFCQLQLINSMYSTTIDRDSCFVTSHVQVQFTTLRTTFDGAEFVANLNLFQLSADL